MVLVVLEKKIPQPLVAAENASDHLVTDNFAKTSSGTLAPLKVSCFGKEDSSAAGGR